MICHILFTAYFMMSLAKGQICKFYGYNADCRYRVDGITMTHVTATINYCNNPIDINFKLVTTNPAVEWHHTFANDNEIQIIPGFGVSVQMQVLLRIVENNKLWVRADFNVDGQRKAYFMDERVELRNLESCVQLNEAGKIALGCLITLFIIAGILLIVLLVIRRRRHLAEHNTDGILEHMESNEHISANSRSACDAPNHLDHSDPEAVVRYSLPTIPEQGESSYDSGHVSIELTNGNVPSHYDVQSGGLPI